MTDTAFRLVIAHRFPIVLHGVAELLRDQGDLAVVAQCTDGRGCLEAVRDHEPDMALVDLALPVVGGLQVLAATAAEQLKTRIVLYAASSSQEVEIAAGMAGGAHGVAFKEQPPERLLHCLREVAAGRKSLPASDVGVRDKLTGRERAVLLLAVEGLRNKEIAARLDIAEGTVKLHLHRIYGKLGVQNRTALADRVRRR